MLHTIDATDKILGRLATEVAVLLRGKHTPEFERTRTVHSMNVVVHNTDNIRVTGRKMDQKLYRKHSGFHGGLKEETLKDLMARDSRLALERAVRGMLPKNRQRDRLMKNLVLYKGEKNN